MGVGLACTRWATCSGYEQVADSLTLRPATAADVPQLLAMIKALAVYEKLEHQVVATAESLHQHLFGDRPYAEALVAEWQGQSAGFALYFHNFSTFLAQPGIHLEDLFVRPEFRGLGIGTALLARLAGIAVARDCGRLEWTVLDWNESARGFYRRLGAEAQTDWIIKRLTGNALQALAARSRP